MKDAKDNAMQGTASQHASSVRQYENERSPKAVVLLVQLITFQDHTK